MAVRDAYPISQGHTQVVPFKHVSTIYELTVMEQNVIWELVSAVRRRLVAALTPDGSTLVLTSASRRGQTVMHAHVHVIPRWSGDVPNRRGGIRWVIADKAAYWTKK